jgi:hypothetical protein
MYRPMTMEEKALAGTGLLPTCGLVVDQVAPLAPRRDKDDVRAVAAPGDDGVTDQALCLALERPPFGQFARQVAPVGLGELAACIRHQRENGGRIGDLLCRRGLLDRAQVREILRLQADWVAAGFRAEFGGGRPFPASLSVCMPAYNEADNLPDTLDAALSILPAFVRDFEVVVVDDGSRDGTGDIVREYAARDQRVRLVSHAQNGGYGAAVTSGLRAARGELVMFCDSDGQFSFLDVPHLLRQMGVHDVAIGYRYRRADHRVRVFNAACWNRLVRLALGVRVRDLDCAFKMFRREVVERLRLTATGAAINAEIMVQVLRGGARVCEVPVTHYPRYAGAPTGAAVKVIARAFRELPRLLKYRFAAPPVQGAAGRSPPAI